MEDWRAARLFGSETKGHFAQKSASLGVAFRWMTGVVWLWKIRDEAEGLGRLVGLGQAKESASQYGRVYQNYAFAKKV